jgi:hypothetical protein
MYVRFYTLWISTIESAVDIATRYELNGPGIESRGGVRFSTPIQTCPGAYPGSYTTGTGSFPGVKWPGCDADHPPLSSAKVKERVKLFLYSPYGSSLPVLGCPLHLPLWMRTNFALFLNWHLPDLRRNQLITSHNCQ